jgi:hypothetical protein
LAETQLMTMREAAAWLGFGNTDAARRRLLRKLMSVGRKYLVRSGGRRPAYLIAKGALQLLAPGLWLTNPEIKREIASELARFRAELGEIHGEIETFRADVAACVYAIRQLQKGHNRPQSTMVNLSTGKPQRQSHTPVAASA